MKVAVVLGTRPEAIKLAPVILALRARSDWQTLVILTGQHQEMVAQVMDLFSIVPDRNLHIMQPRQTLTQITCGSLTGLEPLLREFAPQVLLVQGDTTTAFASALAAFYQQIPIGHVEAGLRTDNLFSPYPEEANRRLISQIAQLHFAPTPQAVANLHRSDVTGEVYLTGNTVIDALLHVASLDLPPPDRDLFDQYRVILATVHRRENWGALQPIAQSFLTILEHCPDVALFLPLHPNPAVREPLQALLGNHPRIRLAEPLPYGSLVSALKHSHLVMTDSGGLQEEAPSLGKPVLVLRDTTERPEAIAAGTAQLVGTDTDRIVAAALPLLQDQALYQRMSTIANPFGDGHATDRILAILAAKFA